MKRTLFVVGYGTIGEVVTRIANRHKDSLDIEVIFYKHSATKADRVAIRAAQDEGAQLAIASSKSSAFKDIGISPDTTFEKALQQANIIIDCTPKGIGSYNKKTYYNKLLIEGNLEKVIFQGSEDGTGFKYVYGTNDSALIESVGKCIQVVSCNTHTLVTTTQLLAGDKLENLISGHFNCVRRTTDVNQSDKGIMSVKVDAHKIPIFGTHHSKDANALFKTLNLDPKITSSSSMTPTQYMHMVGFRMHLQGDISIEEILERCEKDERIAISSKNQTGTIFASGNINSKAFGRTLNASVLIENTLAIDKVDGNSIVSGYCFTPQDGNSLLSSIAAVCYGLYPKDYLEYLKPFKEYLFTEI